MLSSEARTRLLEIATQAVEAAAHNQAFSIDAHSEAEELRPLRATFTTLRTPDGSLRGCTGVVKAFRPLAEDIASTARGAAVADPRFERVQPQELDGLAISLSVLTPMQALEVRTEQELLDIVRPNVDGVMLTDGTKRGLFLPSVWESLPEPRDFLDHLLAKARMRSWSPTTQAHRFQVEKITPS